MDTETIRSRLYYWNANPPAHGYSQTHYSKGPDGHLYRDDCSGYVSMLLGLTGSPNTGMMVGSSFTSPITKTQLRFGDALIAVAGGGHASGHVVLFDRWVDDDQTAYYGHQFGYGTAPLHSVVPYPYQNDGRTFRPYRFHVVTSAAPSKEDTMACLDGDKKVAATDYRGRFTEGSSPAVNHDIETYVVNGWEFTKYNAGRLDQIATLVAHLVKEVESLKAATAGDPTGTYSGTLTVTKQ